MLTQVAGRAGRADRPGEVFIQTYVPTNYALVSAANYDHDAFYRQEIAYRREKHYPPVWHDLHVQFSGFRRDETLHKAHQVHDFLAGRYSGLVIDGPSPSVIERMNRRYRFSLLLRSPERLLLEEAGRSVMQEFPTTEDLWITVTPDPISVY